MPFSPTICQGRLIRFDACTSYANNFRLCIPTQQILKPISICFGVNVDEGDYFPTGDGDCCVASSRQTEIPFVFNQDYWKLADY
ncbi:MAG: hypothetical protein BroJett021_24820 [Chloroflexota bacterium]|nr:MAG: hypothetical protein BroJett021_24820 [Chloroflexota bacterium]